MEITEPVQVYLLGRCPCAMSGSPTSNPEKTQKNRGKFITPPRPTSRRSNKTCQYRAKKIF